MDDDFSFGASVWASSSEAPTVSQADQSEASLPAFTPPPQSDAEFQDDAFGDDDFEFDAPIQASASTLGEDDFGDFGDFGDTVEGDTSGGFAQSTAFGDDDAFTSQGSAKWEALRLDPLPSSSSLKAGIGDFLQPLWDTTDASQFLTEDDIRQVGGLNQILVTPERCVTFAISRAEQAILTIQHSRSLYHALYQTTPPNTQPPNWIRSRIRRRHLVSLGIPVNLDEVLPQVNGRPLPALNITTRPLSAPPGPRAFNRVTSPPPASSGASRPGSRPGSRPPSRSGTPKPSPLARASTFAQLGLGPEPELDERAVNEMLALTPGTTRFYIPWPCLFLINF